MSTYRRPREPFAAPTPRTERRPVDPARIGRSSVRRRARGMTHTEVQDALDGALIDARIASRHEDLATDERGPAELAEWQRIERLLSGTDAVYDPAADSVVQDEAAADRDREHQEQLAADQRRHEEEAETARRAALAPDVLRHALLRTLATAGLLDSLAPGEEGMIERLPYTDPEAALAVNALIARAYRASLDAERSASQDATARP
ncbi:hypothetical protein [Streptomyces sp. NPDC054863]